MNLIDSIGEKMNLCLINNDFRYELEKLVRIFLPYEKIGFYDFVFISDCCAIAKQTEDKAIAILFLNGKISKKTYNIDLFCYSNIIYII